MLCRLPSVSCLFLLVWIIIKGQRENREIIEVVFGHWRYGGDRKRFQSNRAGPCVPSPALGASCASNWAPSDSKHSILLTCMESKKYSPSALSQSKTMCSNFEMMPQKTEGPAFWLGLSGQDPSHLATLFTGAHRPSRLDPGGFLFSSLLVLMAQTDGDVDRLARLFERNWKSVLGGDLRSRSGMSSGSASTPRHYKIHKKEAKRSTAKILR